MKKFLMAVNVLVLSFFLTSCGEFMEYKTFKIKVLNADSTPATLTNIENVINLGKFDTEEQRQKVAADLWVGLDEETKADINPIKVLQSITCTGFTDSNGEITCKLLMRINTTNPSYKIIARKDAKYGISDVLQLKSDKEVTITLNADAVPPHEDYMRPNNAYEFFSVGLSLGVLL